MDLVRLTSPFC